MSYKAKTNFKPANPHPQPQPPFFIPFISFYTKDTIIPKKKQKKNREYATVFPKKKVELIT